MKDLLEVKGRAALMERAATQVRALLQDVPVVAEATVLAATSGDDEADLILRALVAGAPQVALCAVLAGAQPRQVRIAIQQLDAARRAYPADVAALVVAPYVSRRSAEICREAGVGYIDFDGNCRVVLGTVYVERRVERKSPVPPRPLRSLFAPKASQALRVMLARPTYRWRVEELAERAEISLGHASNVRRALLDMEMADADEHGLCLSAPRQLLVEWGRSRRRRRPNRDGYHTLLHGEALERALREACAEFDPPPGQARRGSAKNNILLSSFSAAERIAPFARVPALYAYVTPDGWNALHSRLDLARAPRGPNVLFERLIDPMLDYECGVARGVFHTSAIQTYLDLVREGERGEEAAEHLLQTVISAGWEQP